MSGAAAVLSLARASGIRLRVDEVGRLKVVGRPEMVPFEILVGLRAHKAEIIELLRAGGLGQAANDDDEAFEPVGVIVDEAGNPALPCATCGGRSFHQAPGAPWRCSGCEPPTLPGDAAALAGWSFCSLPATPDEDGPPGAAGSAQNDDSESGRAEREPQRADVPSGAPRPPWSDDREWIWRWRKAGPTMAEREPVAKAWIAAAPSQPLPRCLAAIELARIAA